MMAEHAVASPKEVLEQVALTEARVAGLESQAEVTEEIRFVSSSPM